MERFPAPGIRIGQPSFTVSVIPRETTAAGSPASYGCAVTNVGKGITLVLPHRYASWQDVPCNPIEGDGGLRQECLQEDDFRHWCDPCHKGFNSRTAYDLHLQDHIWCTFPGCKFTCRKDKEWKMEMHVAALHNRPDAPDLADTDKYIESRKKRFPTVETVKCKVEELYYRASRGELLADERRRWLKQHGVYVSRNARTPVMREGDEALQAARSRQERKRLEAEKPTTSNSSNLKQTEGESVEEQRRPAQPAAPMDEVAERELLEAYARKPGQKMLPLGPNGRYTRAQLVIMMRERYDSAHSAPSFYVCNRCGEKGHWVEACPRLADTSYTPVVIWGEGRTKNHDKESSSSSTSSSDEKDSSGDDLPPEEIPANQQPAEADTAPPRKGPDERARLAAKVRSARRAATATESEAKGLKIKPALAPATLFERLTEDDRLNEMGLLLQAFRFFVSQHFFDRDSTYVPTPTRYHAPVATAQAPRRIEFHAPANPPQALPD